VDAAQAGKKKGKKKHLERLEFRVGLEHLLVQPQEKKVRVVAVDRQVRVLPTRRSGGGGGGGGEHDGSSVMSGEYG
jgi:hypothetical protein